MPRLARFEDLDDGCLLEVLKHLTPLPDLFSATRVCRRFRRLASDSRLWKLVTDAATPADAAGGRRLEGRHGRCAYPTLHAAVNASRPGDTIELEAAQAHAAADVAVHWPIRLRGSGAAPEDTVLLCPRGADAALVFSASALLGNLSVHSGAVACLVHRRGRVTVQGCVLTCHAAPGLGHLYAPLVTLARSPRKALAAPGCAAPPAGFPVASPCVKREAPALGAGGGVIQTPGGALRGLSRCGGGGGPVGGRSAGDRWCGGVAVPQCGLGRRLLGIGGGPPAQPGDGVLTVVETRILGSRGSQAVRADGSGVLRGVRAIPLLRGTLFWFKVDSAASGLPDPGAYSGSALPMPQPPAPGLAPEAKGEVRDQRTAADSDGCNCAGGDAGGGGGGIARWTESFQGPDQGTGRAGSGGDEGCAQSGAADGDAAQRRSKTWHAAHHRPGAAPAFAGVPAEAPPAKRQRQG